MSHVKSVLLMSALSASLLALAVMSACDEPPPRIYITSPANGAMIDASSVLVTGTTNQNGTVLVNGSVVSLNPDNSWEVTVPLDQVGVMNQIDAQFFVGIEKSAARITVLAGPSVAEGSYSPEGVGLGFSSTGLDSLLPLVSSLAGDALDISSLLLTGGTIFDDTIFTFDVAATAYDADIGGFDFDATLAPGQIDTTITINGLSLAAEVDINDGLAIDWHCKLEVDMQSAVITGAYTLAPDAAVPTRVDVNQVGDVDVAVNGLSFQFIDGPCDPDVPLIGDLVGILMGDQLEGAIPTGFRESLKDPDGLGPLDSPIAAGIQEALAGIDIAGEVGNAVGVNLDAPFHSITTDSTGIVLNADASFVSSVGTGPGQCDAPYGTIDLTESFVIPSGAPTFGPTAPGGDPYSLGLSISSSAFNQLFKGMVECGLMQIDVTEVEFAGFTVPLTTNIMALLGVPQFQTVLGANTPLVIQIRPQMAPFLTGNPGPDGEMVELGLPHLIMEIVDPATGKKWLLLAIDTRFGLDLAFDPVTAQLAPVVSAPGPGASVARVVSNAIGANEAGVESSIVLVLPSFFAAFGDAFGSFPLPTFFGLQVEVVEIESAGGLFKLYTNLLQAPATKLENVVLTDSSTSDFVTDDVFDTNEWRHRTKLTTTPSTIDTRFRSVIAGDACCTLDDEHVYATADYRLEFDVVPLPGDTWTLDIDHSILGALTTVDEANLLYDGSELAEFTTPIQGRYSVDGGPFVAFHISPSVASVFDDFGGAEDDLNAEVTGSNGVRLNGTTQQHIVVEFTWDMHIFSDSNTAFPAIDGGEGAIRLGMHDTIELGTDPSPGFTAGHYPGQGNRAIGQDGHFVDIDLTAVGCVGDPMICPVCGDGVLAGAEACDDGNGLSGDGCDGACAIEPGFNCGGDPSSCWPACGDGLVIGAETCDDGNQADEDGCSILCQVEPGWTCAGAPSTCSEYCGDGVLVGAEICDDGNSAYGDGCRPTCTPEVCGDGIIDAGELCDDGNTNDGDNCSSDCGSLGGSCQMGGNNCRNFSDGFSLGRNCTSSTLCIATAGWYLLQGTTNGTSLNDYDIAGEPHNLNDIETAQTRTDYNFLNPGVYTVEACDNTGLGISDSPYCVFPADRIAAPGTVNGSLNDSPDLDSGTGEINLAGPISGGDHCYMVDVVRTGSYRINAAHNSGGGLLAAGLYSGTPPNGLLTAAGQSPSPIPVGAFQTSSYVTLTEGTVYHLCADTATLGSNVNYTLALEAQ